MNYTGIRFKLSALSLAIISCSSAAYAAETQESKVVNKAALSAPADISQKKTAKEKDEEIEVITVAGFRGSLMKSMMDKRTGDNVTDSIFAEDIGKSTDQNIADALSRVTGVSVQSQDGEGTKITVRGANPDQNMISLNGVQLTSSDFNQSVDLSSFSSDILSSINVVKTPSADHDEGSLGATILLNTARPLSLDKNLKSVTLQGRYNDFSEEDNYKFAGSFSHKFLDDSFGVLFTVFDETNAIRRDEWNISKFEAADVKIARDQHGNIITDTKALRASSLNYSLYQNKRDRQGGTATFQWMPSDETDIVMDLTYSKQSLTDTNHGVVVRLQPRESTNYFEGETHNTVKRNGEGFVPGFSDPQQDWWTVNTDTRTLVKAANRFADGGYNRRNGGSDTTNKVFNLTAEHYFTDNIKFNAGFSYSATHLAPIPTINMGLLSLGAQNKQDATQYGDPHTGIQPAGYDCTEGPCRMIFGNGPVSQQNPLTAYDNITSTAWNPDDISSHATNNVNINEREVEDTIKTAYFDVDWDIDFAGFTSIEFGAKVSKRDKYVDDQSGDFRNAGKAITVNVYDADGNVINQRVIQSGQSLGSISADNYTFEGAFPYNNFLQDLGVPQDEVTNGWPLVSAERLLEFAHGNENLNYVKDDSKTRNAILDNQAAYLKLNFEYDDLKLRGDVGVRWVRTELETFGSSGVRYNEDGFGRIFDPFLFNQLRNLNLQTCANLDNNSPNANGSENRIDGLGWDRTTDPDNPTRIPADANGYPCFDPAAARDVGNEFWNLTRHADPTHLRQYKFADDPSANEDRSLQSFKTSGENTYDLFLPSLNLTYAASDDLIGRFAISKTMSRPNIDSLKPGFSVNEGLWGAFGTTRGGRITLNNPKLMPQESNNLDLSIEWYFNETSLLSAGFFYKKLSNFEETENAIVYADDLRFINVEEGYSAGDLIKTEEQLRVELQDENVTNGVGKNACLPARGHIFNLNEDWWFDNSDLLNWCAKLDAQKVRNGKGAKIAGLELQYTQSFDFLPGIWSGLGTSINYTYQDSKTDKEYSSFDDTKALPQLPQAWTPKHSYNATFFWEKDGHQIRLAYRGKSDELIDRTWQQGSLWREGNATLDLSAAYQVTENISLTFNAINITDTTTRNYFTSRLIELGDTAVNADGETINVPFDEGNPLEDSSVSKERTQLESKTGRIFRLGLRVNF